MLKEGDEGVSIYVPAAIRKNFDIEAGDEVQIAIAEEKAEGDQVDAFLVILG
ncbi:MAG: hypothetical protein V5A88_07360 [Candidatus Thermoplasmatota archaeon]